jgi:hypothetical protein
VSSIDVYKQQGTKGVEWYQKEYVRYQFGGLPIYFSIQGSDVILYPASIAVVGCKK